MRPGAVRWLSPVGYFTLRWWEWGPADGAPVVCVHGLTRTGRDFDALAQALGAAGRRVICPDLPGRGASDWLPAPALYQPPSYVTALSYLLARLDGPVDWVGTSLGGICGMAVAATRGNPVRRLVLNDIGATIPQAAMARIVDYMATPPPFFADVAALEAHLRRVHAPFGALTDAQWRHLAETSARPVDGGVALHYDPAIADPICEQEPEAVDMRGLWNMVRQPVLLIRGAESDLLLPGTARMMAEAEHVRLVEIAGAGHAPALMDPAQIALVAGFLDQ
ncbi:alpha/beta fold hydrolase [Roseomonas sp. CECT 9278]|uniref:alpha/beta fold hydrolase n=1 Tax=Roseomonas sp. CECT 9278 TaxID=2845823 RepID=UPI001E3F5EDC|nr:alpha/beta hydrolase [Roseomonas sp. CECT 9278]CAH0137793.1 2-succinyl-6-hydroxy-2, 4-cyclohexadiene-1-carboxylate synthase [Roseomonas sp. CECT 9278]